ncbi:MULTISPECIES: hypothetical protein [unclassified Coleofasciculus]|uniref:hypothetical protein n=1 Tax=unclassified Coleofasciculus TaxID=2692782 RepID=UPI001D15AD00|nr:MULTISPECIES: hypothetical protein [unclassified Coleofasciculus]
MGQARIHLDQAPSEVKELAQTFDKMLLRLFDAWEQQRLNLEPLILNDLVAEVVEMARQYSDRIRVKVVCLQ